MSILKLEGFWGDVSETWSWQFGDLFSKCKEHDIYQLPSPAKQNIKKKSLVERLFKLFDNQENKAVWSGNGSNTIQKQPPEVLYKKGVLKSLAILTRKYLCQRLLLNSFMPQPVTLWEKILLRRCFLVNFAKFSRTPF